VDEITEEKIHDPPGELISAVHAPDPTKKSAMLFYAERDRRWRAKVIQYVVCGTEM
jgi:hypothetical protein